MKEQDAEIWCPACHTPFAVIYRVQVNESHWTHETEPANVPARCTCCETVLERKRV